MEMRELNKKGFTLIELLAVLVILVIIMSIAIPSITSSVERSKDKQKKEVINIAKAQAELYLDKNKNSLTSGSIITINKLVCDGYLTLEDVKDPTNEKYAVNVSFVVGSNNTLTISEHDGYGIEISTFNDDSCS